MASRAPSCLNVSLPNASRPEFPCSSRPHVSPLLRRCCNDQALGLHIIAPYPRNALRLRPLGPRSHQLAPFGVAATRGGRRIDMLQCHVTTIVTVTPLSF